MNEVQIKAGKKLKSALRSCAKAGLVVHAFTDVGFFVLPLTALEDDTSYKRDSDPQAFHDKHGVDCQPPNPRQSPQTTRKPMITTQENTKLNYPKDLSQ